MVGMSLVCFNYLNLKTATTDVTGVHSIIHHRQRIFFFKSKGNVLTVKSSVHLLNCFILHFSSKLQTTKLFVSSISIFFFLNKSHNIRYVQTGFDLFVMFLLHVNRNLNCAFWYAYYLHIREASIGLPIFFFFVCQ